ncbi:Nuclear factor [Orchesella cincta]|uniref:Nuclear factor n=1 Tax=Orchesella cincta TaxID=48709 RepID=A0A1D2NKD1_ORCCI|nr:Nuclear factor [Orchesella cincta]
MRLGFLGWFLKREFELAIASNLMTNDKRWEKQSRRESLVPTPSLLKYAAMTTDPPEADFEDVRIGNWESRLPSAICTNKEIFDEIFSFDTWKTTLKPDQRDRIMKMLPPEVLKVPGAAEKVIEDLFSKSLTNFDFNPLDTFFDKLNNGHYDPEVVQTKTNIVREWKKESFRLRKHYHTKLLQDIVISREEHLRKLVPLPKKNGKKSIANNNNNNNNIPSKKNGKAAAAVTNNNTNNNNGTVATNGVGGKGKGQKNETAVCTVSIPAVNNNNARSKSTVSESNKNKRSKDAALLSPPASKDSVLEGPSKKRAKQNSTTKSKAANKKTKEIVIVTSQQAPPQSVSVTIGNGTVAQQKSVLLGTLTSSQQVEPQILALRSSSQSTASPSPLPPSSLLESLTAPINAPPPIVSNETLKSFPKMFSAPSPTLLSSSVSTSSTTTSFFPSPVQSSPILASQLQAPSPISVNLSTITSLRSGNGSNASSPSASQSSITLNYTQAPAAATITSQHHGSKGLMDDESSSDEFEFETIEPTIGFSGSTIPSSKSSTMSSSSSCKTAFSTTGIKKSPSSSSLTTISTQQLASIQKCSLLTNCLTQPLSNSSSAAATAALANNILTSGSPNAMHQLSSPQQKIIVTTGLSGSSAGAASAQLHKFIPTTSLASSTVTTQKLIAHHSIGDGSCSSGIFQQRNVISSASGTNPNLITSAADTQTLVSSIMSSSKEIFASFGASLGSNQQHSTSSASVLPISSVTGGTHQVAQLKQAFIRASPATGLLPSSSIASLPQQQILSLPPQQGSSLNTQSLQLPSSILSSKSSSVSIPNLLDSDDLSLNLGSFSMGLGGMNLDMGVGLSEMDGSMSGMGVVGGVDNIKLEMDCGMDKMDDLSVLDGNPFDSIPNLSDELDGLDLDMVDGLCDFEVLLSDEKQYSSFFSLIRDVLCSTRDHRMTLVCLDKTIKKWALSPGAAVNPWYMRVGDWNSSLVAALNFLAGNYQDVHPEDFVPYIEYKYKTKYYQWIGAGRDGDNNLTPLCNLWMDNLERLPPLRKAEGEGEEPEEEEDENEDSDTAGGEDAKKKNKRPLTPPPPRCTTDWTVRPSTLDEKDEFRAQEKSRFDNPHKAFTYRMHGYESVVGPVKGVYSSQTGITNKARGHSLLVDDRPPYVTILALVRDAVARLPNGEGTRSEICEMLRDSAFLAPEASSVTLNSVVSGALDRLHYERDPCVRYDSHKKSWIYLHRDRTQEQFERLHHNRSYTKSTKSRNNSNRKGRKGSSKSSKDQPTIATSISSSSSSQCSISAMSSTESPLSTAATGTSTNTTTITSVVGNNSGGGIVTSGSSGSTLVTIPSLSTIAPKVQSNSTLPQKQIASTPSSLAGGIQAQPPIATTTSQAIINQPTTLSSASNTSSLSTGRGSAVSGLVGDMGKSVVTTSLQQSNMGDGTTSSQQQTSLSEVFAASTGLRFQSMQSALTSSSTGSSIVLNQGMIGQQNKLPPQPQSTFLQEQMAAVLPPQTPTTTRLLLQPTSPTTSVQLPTVGQSQQQQLHVQVQNSGQCSTSSLLGTVSTASTPVMSQASNANAIAPGQILLGSSAVLKLAGNIRLGEGLRLTQLRLPGTTGAIGTSGSPLRLPQHRILLARGTIPGQPQAQGVLLGQTSTGQTVILSAASPTAGALGTLQQALAGGASAQLNQIALHASQQVDMQQGQQQQQQSSNLSQQQSHQQSTSLNQQTLSFTTSAGTTAPKFGIITNVPMGVSNAISSSSNTNAMTVSSGVTTHSIQNNYSTRVITAQSQQQLVSSAVTLSTSSSPSSGSISLPTTILAPVSSGHSATVTGTTVQSSQNITLTTNQSHQQQQQLLSAVVGGLSSNSVQGSQVGTVHTVNVPIGMTSNAQQQHHHNLLGQLQSLQAQQNQQQGLGQAQGVPTVNQLSAPILIRSAEAGVKLFPIQTGKQTVLARIVAPGTPTTSSMVSGSVSSPLPTSVISTSGALTSASFVSGSSLQQSLLTVVTSTSTSGIGGTVTTSALNNQSSATGISFICDY